MWGRAQVENTISGAQSSIDWLTLTATTPVKRRGLVALGELLVAKQQKADNDRRDWRWKGFSGTHAKGVSWGRREDCDILELSGLLADEQADHAWLTADHCTRIDLCVTAKVEGDYGNVADRTAAEVLAWKAASNSTLTVKTIADNGRTNTVYLGRRASDIFARVYDKGLESGEPSLAGFWRWELEIKGEPAQRAIGALHSLGDREHRIRSTVHEYLSRRGCRPIFSSVGDHLHVRALRAPSDTATRLGWLAASVRPAVERLLLDGHAGAVCEALGLDHNLVEQFRLKRQLEYGNHARDNAEWLGGDLDAN